MDRNVIVIEDGKITHNFNDSIWDGLFSKFTSDGKIMQYIQSCVPENAIIVIPKSDGNINKEISIDKWHDVDWENQIKPFKKYAESKDKTLIIGTLCQIDMEPTYNYLYIPLDDDFFENGVCYYFNKNELPKWENRLNELCWRGGCSGVGGINSIRSKFVKKIYEYNCNTNVRLSTWWSENKNIPAELFADRVHFSVFLHYKIFFIVDGNCIASNHMYGFATGCVPFLISNSKCWFTDLIVPYEHYIPVNYDLSNLIEQIEWVKNNDDEAKKIAKNAYKFAETHFSSEYQKNYIKQSINKLCGKLDI